MPPITRINSLTISGTNIIIGYNNVKAITDGNIQAAVSLYTSNKSQAIKAYGRIESWDTSEVQYMYSLFSKASFNQNIGSWNTSKVEQMYGMFGFTYTFNQNIGSWNTSKVTDMSYMFYNAKSFNQDINKWNISLVKANDYYNRFGTNSQLCNPFNKSYAPKGMDPQIACHA